VDGLDDVGLGQAEQVVVALEVTGPFGEPLAPEVRLGQPVPLDHGPHGAVEHEDAPTQRVTQVGGGVRPMGSGHAGTLRE